jgi:hypothetical protein
MAIYYFDASAIVKYFNQEPGTRWVRQIIDARTENSARANQVHIADVSLAEVPAAFAILERSGRTGTRVRDLMYNRFLKSIGNEFQLWAVTTVLAYAAGELTQNHSLKGYDAVQLAVALDFSATLKQHNLALVFVSGDDNLLQAARAEGLATENPFDHE